MLTVTAVCAEDETTCGTAKVIIVEPAVYTITLPIGEGYIASAADNSSSPIQANASHSFTVELLDGYRQSTFFAVKSNGEKLTVDENNVYTKDNIAADQVVTVEGLIKTYVVTLPDKYVAAAPVEGCASPVDEGGSYSFTVTVADGCRATDAFAVKANDAVLTADENGVYTIASITADQVITVEGVGYICDGWMMLDDEWWYYYTEGKPLTDLHELEGYKRGGGTQQNTYVFDESGIMQTGFFSSEQLGLEGSEWYFFYERKEGSSGNPVTSNHGQMVKGYYVEAPSQGYISESELATIESGKDRVYRYYFSEDGAMYTGWYNNDMAFDQQGRWRYFVEKGSSPMTSRLGRMCRYGIINEEYCLGNNGENHSYFFSSTGGMMTGEKVIHGETVMFNAEGVDPETDLLGALIK